MTDIASSIADLVGSTPLVRINRVIDAPATVLAKCLPAASHCTTLTGASTTVFHYLKSAKYLRFAVSGLGTIKGLEGQLKDFGAGSF